MTDGTFESGIALAELSDTIRPQDDLFRHVNERWIARTPIPADKSSYGSFWVLDEQAERAIRDVIEEAQGAALGSASRKFGDLYTSFLDEDRVEAVGGEPLGAPMALVETVVSPAHLLRIVGELQRQGLVGLYSVFIDNDPGSPDRYVVFLEQGGLSLPDESYYREEHFAVVREAFVRHVERMFSLADVRDAALRARRVFDLETEIASRHWDNVASRDSEKTYNLMTWRAAEELFQSGRRGGPDDGVTLEGWRNAFGAPEGALDEVVLRQPSFTEGVAQLVDDEHLDAWKDWLTWQIIASSAPYLSKSFVEERFDFYGRTLTGAQQLRERWKRGVAFVEGAMGEAVGEVYVERHFPPAAKTRMDALVASLIEAYRQSITSLDWMTAETRHRALEKLDAFTPKIGYPVTWRDYSTLAVDPGDLMANVRAANAFELRRQLAKIGQPVDRDEWLMTPQTINAYYNPGFNEIVFPAAILQPPFFDATRDDAANYGAIGAVIGHEIGHGFDDQGSKFDGAGRLVDWWTPEDRSAFEERTRALIEQFNELSPRQTPEHHVNGALTVGENIGDLGGLGIAWKAYVLSLNGAPSPEIDGLSGAQRFFISWAQAWQYQSRTEEVERLLATDPHSPCEFRCNQIIRNLDAFYEAFDVRANDALWLEPSRRIVIW